MTNFVGKVAYDRDVVKQDNLPNVSGIQWVPIT
jgi:hypothetical protein